MPKMVTSRPVISAFVAFRGRTGGVPWLIRWHGEKSLGRGRATNPSVARAQAAPSSRRGPCEGMCSSLGRGRAENSPAGSDSDSAALAPSPRCPRYEPGRPADRPVRSNAPSRQETPTAGGVGPLSHTRGKIVARTGFPRRSRDAITQAGAFLAPAPTAISYHVTRFVGPSTGILPLFIFCVVTV